MMRKKGWPREKCQEKWNQQLAESWERDHAGEDGELRLWLPKKEYKIKEKEDYMDQRTSTQSENIKNPSASDVYALTMHVHAKSKCLNFQHSFFHGGAGTPYLNMVSREAEGVPAGEDGDGDEENEDGSGRVAEPPVKKLKGAIVKLRAQFNQVMDKTASKASSSK